MNNNEMLKSIREHYGLQRNVDFARFFGISEQLANSWNNSGKLDLVQIYKRCPDINPDWLLSGGQGNMIRSEQKEDEEVDGGRCKVKGEYTVPDSLTVDIQSIKIDCLSVVQSSLDAMKKEQEISSNAQQISMTLLEVVKNMTTPQNGKSSQE